MKDNLKLIKSKKGSGKDTHSKALPPGTLFVVFRNKPLIDLWAISNLYPDDYYDKNVPAGSSVYTTSDSSLCGDDRIPVMLSPEDAMLLYNEGLSEYY